MERIIRSLVFLTGMMILSKVLKGLYAKNTRGAGEVEEEVDINDYQLSVPPLVRQVYGAMFLFGIVLFGFFYWFYAKGEANVTIGHFNFAIVLSLIGLIVIFFAHQWRVYVQGDTITVRNIIGMKKTFLKKDIERIDINFKGTMKIYVSGKKVKEIGMIIINYGVFMEDMERHGKL